MRDAKVKAIVVTSGAIGVGRNATERPRPKTLPEKQALAAIGQISLMHTYQEVFAERGLRAAQILITRGDMEDRRRYLNARYTLERLLELDAVPVINENDTTATEEIGFGDNDMLSAYVAVKTGADVLLLLSSVDGVHRPPKDGTGKRGEVVAYIPTIDEAVLGWAGRDISAEGTGGMRSKLLAAKLATEAGVATLVASGKRKGGLAGLAEGIFNGTYIAPAREQKISARARWIGFGRASRGHRLILDEGALEAVARGNQSLLPVGIAAVEGEFEAGALVELCAPSGRAIARGLVNYGSRQIDQIKGRKSAELDSILGSRPYDEVIHRDNLVILP
jgi:glutamate 5-kinase